MKLHRIEQNSVDWQILRSGKITASELDSIISPLGKVRDSDGVNTYVAQKLCEIWTGGPLLSLQGIFDADQGKFLEERAKPAFTVHTGFEIENVGFIESDDGRSGCSPDGCIMAAGEVKGGVEIKCPRMDTHLKYLLAGKVPKEYVAQVQGSMFVTGCDYWHFFSYCRNLPPLHLVVHRDEEFQEALGEAIDACVVKLDVAMSKLIELNGGLPKRFSPTPKPQPKPSTPMHEQELVP